MNRDYDKIRAQILSRDPFPTLTAYAVIQSEESRRNVMSNVPFQERTAMAIIPHHKSIKNDENGKERRNSDHCMKLGHTKDKLETPWMSNSGTRGKK